MSRAPLTADKRTAAVTMVACLYLAVGTVGFISHFPRVHSAAELRQEDFWIEITEVLAVVAGAFLLRRQNWARWLALAWMAFHVILSFFHPAQLAVHVVFFVAILWLLFRRDSAVF